LAAVEKDCGSWDGTAMHGKMGISGVLAALVALAASGCCAPILHWRLPVAAEPEKVEQGVPTSFPPRPRLHPVPTRPVFQPVKTGERAGGTSLPKPAAEPKAPQPAAELQASFEQPSAEIAEVPQHSPPVAEAEQRSVLVKPAGQWRVRTK
jgi:hypothetical protein